MFQAAFGYTAVSDLTLILLIKVKTMRTNNQNPISIKQFELWRHHKGKRVLLTLRDDLIMFKIINWKSLIYSPYLK